MKKTILTLSLSSVFAASTITPFTVALAAQTPIVATKNAESIPSLAPMLKKVMPAVVNIAAENRAELISEEGENDGNEGNEPSNEPNNKQTKPPRRQAIPNQSIGSGVVLDAKKGYILTNAHLLKNAQSVTVTLTDGRHFKAKKIGLDEGSDVAVVQIEATNLASLPIGNPNDLNVGDPVVAIGNPFGLNRFGPTSTATSGIISALHRSGMEIESYENFIQTDASINPGNSGGALVNMHGELIGINTAILAPGGGNVGIGFAIPINMANSIAQQLIKYGAVRRGLMGILVQSLTPELAQAFNIKNEQGALVSMVNTGSPAQKAGLKVGDLITQMNGQTIDSAAQIRNIVGLLRVNDHVTISLLRQGKKINLSMRIVDPRKHEEQRQNEDSFLFGVALKDFYEDSPYHGEVKGVQVTGLLENSPAFRAGLRPGDIITLANQESVDDVDALKKAMKKNQNELLIHILRGPSAAFVVVK